MRIEVGVQQAADREPETVAAPHRLVGRAGVSRDGHALALGRNGCVWLFDVAVVREET
jgi:hypothetical protein